MTKSGFVCSLRQGRRTLEVLRHIGHPRYVLAVLRRVPHVFSVAMWAQVASATHGLAAPLLNIRQQTMSGFAHHRHPAMGNTFEILTEPKCEQQNRRRRSHSFSFVADCHRAVDTSHTLHQAALRQTTANASLPPSIAGDSETFLR